ncbi:hypothetical protein ACHAXH_001300 [Discostella pseudostelligera]
MVALSAEGRRRCIVAGFVIHFLPAQWIDAIVAFHHKNTIIRLPIDTKDQLCRCHPAEHPRQKKEYAPVIYQYKTWDQLWIDFHFQKDEHPARMAAHIRNGNQEPNNCPMVLRLHAPWNMIKGKDSSCLLLCINCKGTNAVI